MHGTTMKKMKILWSVIYKQYFAHNLYVYP